MTAGCFLGITVDIGKTASHFRRKYLLTVYRGNSIFTAILRAMNNNIIDIVDCTIESNDLPAFITLPYIHNAEQYEMLAYASNRALQHQFIYMTIDDSPIALFDYICNLMAALLIVRPKYIDAGALIMRCIVADNITEFNISINSYYNRELNQYYVLPIGQHVYITRFTFIDGNYVMYIRAAEYIEQLLLLHVKNIYAL